MWKFYRNTTGRTDDGQQIMKHSDIKKDYQSPKVLNVAPKVHFLMIVDILYWFRGVWFHRNHFRSFISRHLYLRTQTDMFILISISIVAADFEDGFKKALTGMWLFENIDKILDIWTPKSVIRKKPHIAHSKLEIQNMKFNIKYLILLIKSLIKTCILATQVCSN